MNTDNTIILTRRVQLLADSSDREVAGEVYKTLYRWRYACFRAANFISTHLYVQEQVKDLLYLTGEVRVRLTDSSKDDNGILTTSRLNSTYRVLAAHFKGEVPMHILSSLNMTLAANFQNEKAACLRGERSVRSYKHDIPIPFRGTDIKGWHKTADEKGYAFTLFGIPLRTYLGRDLTDKRALLNKMMAGEIQLCTSSIQLKDNKIFLLASFRLPKERHELDETIIAEASLSMEYPVTVTVNKSRYQIGTREEFLYRRLAIQAAYRRAQQGLSYSSGGNGRKRKLKALERLGTAEKDYINNKLHVYSRRLIDICVKHRAATLVLTGQQEKEAVAREDGFLLRNWSYYALKEKIAYKAEKAGILVIEE